jgi:hypothetical protein
MWIRGIMDCGVVCQCVIHSYLFPLLCGHLHHIATVTPELRTVTHT